LRPPPEDGSLSDGGGSSAGRGTISEILQSVSIPEAGISALFGRLDENLRAIEESFGVKLKTESSGYNHTPILGKAVGSPAVLSRLPTLIRRIVTSLPVWRPKQWSILSRQPQQTSSSSRSPLRRMASARKLVTSLTRLLGTKSEVVSQIRKRLTGRAMMGLNVGQFEQALAAEISIYLGDIQGQSNRF